MAAAPVTRRFNLEQYVVTEIKKIAKDPRSDDVTRRVLALTNVIGMYAKQVDVRDVRSRFFLLDLRNRITLLNSSVGDERLLHYAKKVGMAVIRLVRVHEHSDWRPLYRNLQQAPHPMFDEWIRTNNKHRLQQLKIESIDHKQVDTLFDWALANWDTELLVNLISTCDLSIGRIGAVASFALERNQFHILAIPIMLFHFQKLPGDLQAKISRWIDAKPMPRNPEEFPTLVKEMVQIQRSAGAFNHLLNPELMKTLPQDVAERLFEWAEEYEDDQLIFFMIEHDLVSDLFNDIVLHALDDDDFERVVDFVLPYNLSHLPEITQKRVNDWVKCLQEREVLRLKGNRDEPEEKFDPTKGMAQLRELIREARYDLVGKFVQSNLVEQLETDQICELFQSIDPQQEGIIAALQLRLDELLEIQRR